MVHGHLAEPGRRVQLQLEQVVVRSGRRYWPRLAQAAAAIKSGRRTFLALDVGLAAAASLTERLGSA
jgi:hypothetical protein